MAFHDTRLPDQVERGAQGGPGFKTTILVLSSGFEKRNIDWSRARGQWDLSYGIDNKAEQEEVLAFFYARQGRAHSFRFKDWTDFVVGDATTNTPQPIATADGVLSEYQITRLYADSFSSFSREITRPVAGTVRVFLNSIEQFSGVTVDDTTGVVTFDAPPLSLIVVGIICEYDNPVRFDSDNLGLTATTEDAYSFPSVPIVEVREALQVLTT